MGLQIPKTHRSLIELLLNINDPDKIKVLKGLFMVMADEEEAEEDDVGLEGLDDDAGLDPEDEGFDSEEGLDPEEEEVEERPVRRRVVPDKKRRGR